MEIKQAILDYRDKYKLRNETEAVIQLLNIALFVDEQAKRLQDPEIVAFLKQRLYDQNLVDWAFRLEGDRLEALFALLRSARELRFRKTH